MSKRITRKEFLGVSIICVVLFLVLGTGLSKPQVAYGQTTNLRFSTWHVPVGYEVKTVWEPMLEELKKKSQGKNHIHHVCRKCSWEKDRNILTLWQKVFRIWATSPPPGRLAGFLSPMFSLLLPGWMGRILRPKSGMPCTNGSSIRNFQA